VASRNLKIHRRREEEEEEEQKEEEEFVCVYVPKVLWLFSF
jgi:hypothetical protein